LLKYHIQLKAPYPIFVLIFICCTQFVIAQTNKKKSKKVEQEIKHKMLQVFRPDSVAPYIISAEGDTINRTDQFNIKQGVWVEKYSAKFGDGAITKIGSYIDNWKTGSWNIYENAELIAIENYANNVLSGKYSSFENGRLYCQGFYKANRFKQKLDTLEVVHPQTSESRFYIYSNSPSSWKDSTWTYYYPNSKVVEKIQIWQNDEMLSEKTFPRYGADTSNTATAHPMPNPNNQSPYPSKSIQKQAEKFQNRNEKVVMPKPSKG
jgi:hypothetical protein